MIVLDAVFQSGMVLQQGKPVHISGKAAPGSSVRVTCQKKQSCVTAGDDGRFEAELPPLAASDAETLSVSAGGECEELTDVAVGEVFLAGGQSNMEFLMRYEKHMKEEREVCEDALLRFYDVPEVAFAGQKEAFDYSEVGIWREAHPESLDRFCAVGYYFAKELRKALDVPVGIIGCNWGGTRVSAWMPEAEAKQYCPLEWADYYGKVGEMPKEEQAKMYLSEPLIGMNDRSYKVFSPFDEFILPRTPSMEEIGAAMAAMGGGEGGGVDFASYAEIPKCHHCPGALYEWMFTEASPMTVRGVLWYQGESEDECSGSPQLYGKALSVMMADWRKDLREPELPFFIVQLPGYSTWLGNTAENFPAIRACQQEVCDSDPNAFLCSIHDAGEEFDIHPKDKKVVGERLSLLALKHLYEKNVTADPPRFAQAKRAVEKDKDVIRIGFTDTGDGLKKAGDPKAPISALELFDGDRKLDFEAGISGDGLVLALSEHVDGPVTIRFAKTNWYLVNLTGSTGIPAIPFEAVV